MSAVAEPAGLLPPPTELPPGAPPPIAYLGSSVTVQRRDGYRPLLHAELCRRSGRPHRAINAGFGGVGSISGLFMVDDLVLRHRPSLCFVEFAPTDMLGLTPPDRLRAVLETLVVRLRNGGCEPCFLLLGRLDSPPHRESTLATYRKVAASQGVACVDLADELDADPATRRDVVHTSPAGAVRIAGAAAAAVAGIDPDGGRPPGVAPLSPALMQADATWLRDPEAGAAGTVGDLFGFVVARPGNPFTARLEGELVGLVVAVGPTAAGVRVIGGGHDETAVLWDEWCHYERLMTTVFEHPRPAGAEVCVECVPVQVDYSIAHRPVTDPDGVERDLRLIAFMVLE